MKPKSQIAGPNAPAGASAADVTAAQGAAPADATQPGQPAEQQIAMNGFQQVLDMLKIADPEFRESLLRRLGARDRKIAQRLRDELKDEGL